MKEAAQLCKSSLTERERGYLEAYVRQEGLPLAPTTQAQLFRLFLNGKGLEEIHKLNPLLPYGAIIMASLEGNWHAAREGHVERLLDGVRGRVIQTQLESITFISDALAAAHAKYGAKFQKYLQTGDPKELGEDWIKSFRQYKEALSVLMMLTGQDKTHAPPLIPSAGSPQSNEDTSPGGSPAAAKTLEGSWGPRVAGKILQAIEDGEDD